MDVALHRSWTRAVDRAIGNLVEPLAAALLLIEVGILAAGVFWRYVLHDSLIWSGELASILFLWLIMLGAVGAYRRGEHMGLTVLVRRLPARSANICKTIGSVIVALFSLELLGALIWPTALPFGSSLTQVLQSMGNLEFFFANYLSQEAYDYTPALRIPVLYVLLGIAIGMALILILAVIRLIDGVPKYVLPILATTLVVVVGAYLGRDALSALGNLNLILFFVILIGAQVTIGVPIAFAFGMSTVNYLALTTTMPLSVVAGQMQGSMTDLILLTVPLFILLGLLMECVGIARRLVEAIAAFVGHLRGGLNLVLVGAMFLVSGISGSKLADMAAITPVLFPEMERRGHKRSEMVSLLSTSGAMAELIPPSIVLIILGTVCNLSIQSLFIGGLLPAAIAALALVFVSLLRSRKEKVELAPSARWATRIRMLAIAIPGLVLALLIRFLVAEGIATATEVSTIGVIYSVIVGLVIYREFDWRRVYPMLRDTANLTGSIMLIIAMATAMSWALTQSGFAATLAQMLEHAPGGKAGFIALSIVLFILLGMFLEGIPAIVLFGPLFFPIARELGVHDIHYAVIVILSMSIGLFAPPFGVSYYGACAIGKCDPGEASIAILPYLAALLAALIVIAAVPWLSIGFL
jgi:tripartite ATP-independent transporter DctM subunit